MQVDQAGLTISSVLQPRCTVTVQGGGANARHAKLNRKARSSAAAAAKARNAAGAAPTKLYKLPWSELTAGERVRACSSSAVHVIALAGSTWVCVVAASKRWPTLPNLPARAMSLVLQWCPVRRLFIGGVRRHGLAHSAGSTRSCGTTVSRRRRFWQSVHSAVATAPSEPFVTPFLNGQGPETEGRKRRRGMSSRGMSGPLHLGSVRAALWPPQPDCGVAKVAYPPNYLLHHFVVANPTIKLHRPLPPTRPPPPPPSPPHPPHHITQPSAAGVTGKALLPAGAQGTCRRGGTGRR